MQTIAAIKAITTAKNKNYLFKDEWIGENEEENSFIAVIGVVVLVL